MSCCDSNYETLVVDEDRPQELKPVQLWHACATVGWFLDMLRTDPETAMKHFGRAEEHPLRGCFEPSIPKAPTQDDEHYRNLRFAVSGRTGDENGCLTRLRMVFVSCIFVLCCPSLVQFYCWQLLKDPCKDFPGRRCQLFKFFDSEGGGALLTLANLGVVLTAYVVLRSLWRLCKLCCHTQAMAAAQFVTVKLFDKMALEKLPNTVGVREKVVMLGVSALFLSFAALASIDMNAGILAFGQLVAVYFLLSGNAVLGDLSSLEMLRERHILNVAEETAQDARISLSAADVRMKVSEFLHTKPSYDAVIIDLKILVLLQALIWFPSKSEPESLRLRKFIVPVLYSALSESGIRAETGEWLGVVKSKHDVVVDVFSKTCSVIGVPDHVGSRWAKEGERLPWHFAVEPVVAGEVANELYKLGLVSGAGCFAPAGRLDSNWESADAVPTYEKRLERAKRLLFQRAVLERELVDFLGNMRTDNLEPEFVCSIVKAFMAAGANLHRPCPKTGKERPQILWSVCLLLRSHPQSVAFMDCCKYLMEAGSNLESKVWGKDANMDLFDRLKQVSVDVTELKEFARSLKHQQGRDKDSGGNTINKHSEGSRQQ